MSLIKGIKCVAPVFDRSGYAEWSRNYILALSRSGLPITVEPVSFDKQMDVNSSPELQEINSLRHNSMDYNVVICWLIPPAAASVFKHQKSDAFKVLFTLWETTELPNGWPQLINDSVDECWLAGEWSKEVFKNSGVTAPMKGFSYPINFDHYNIDASVINRPFSEDTYLFYFISQWTERKNFSDLLEAYWSEFSKEDNVALLIKTHISSNSEQESDYLAKVIKSIKDKGDYGSTSPVVLLTEMFSNEQILALHKISDCYVSPSRGEGLGLGILEAGLFGNTVISNSFGEQSSYISSNSAHVYGHTLRPVTGMNNPFYTSEQYWCQPDVYGMAKAMRKAYEERKSSRRGNNLKAYLKKKCSYSKVASDIKHSLNNSLEKYYSASGENR